MSEQQDVAAAGLALVEAVLSAAPQLLLSTPQLPQAVAWCCAALQVREAPPAAAAVSLLHALVTCRNRGIMPPSEFEVLPSPDLPHFHAVCLSLKYEPCT